MFNSPKQGQAAQSLYTQVMKAIELQIRSGKLGPHDQVPSIRELAREHKVSEITARRSVFELVHAGLLYTRPGIGVFVSQEALQRPAHSPEVVFEKSAVVGFKGSPEERDTTYGWMLEGVRQAAEPHGITIYNHHLRDIARFGGPEAYVRTHGLQGVILMGLVNATFIRQMAALVPTVLLDAWMDDPELDYVVVDNVPAAYALTKHLLDLGHRRIAYVGGMRFDQAERTVRPDPDSFERQAGYRIALEGAGLVPSEAWIFPRLDAQGESARRLLALDPRPTAVVCFDSVVAQRLKDCCEAQGLRVPMDLALASFSGDPAWAKGAAPYPCACVDLERMGRLAMERLVDRVVAGATPSVKLSVPGSLVLPNLVPTTGIPVTQPVA